MIDPLYLAAALDFLNDPPALRIPFSPVTPQRRRFMLKDTLSRL